ncbi:hypothetical protein BDN72DRAFT_844911 [Pluteus cervinus]|uniref:Uncharacterized protein n=1 Tax=Pluteus cervinus TaxID=181527 RepID=A0ACD3AKE8_9AGAR|nr:hypothetical protein BDN72DRAFT_844911 [Pluteus cervinus]
MSEVVNVIVAFAVIVIIFRWVTSGNDSTERGAADVLGFRPKNVTQDMIDTIHNMFPDVPADNIRYDLLRTGSVEQTTEKLLSRGFLEAPPAAYYTLYPRPQQGNANGAQGQNQRGGNQPGAGSTKPIFPPAGESLINRFGLQDRVASGVSVTPEEVGGKAAWEDTTEKREALLKERKAQMILAARQRFLQQQQEKAAS